MKLMELSSLQDDEASSISSPLPYPSRLARCIGGNDWPVSYRNVSADNCNSRAAFLHYIPPDSPHRLTTIADDARAFCETAANRNSRTAAR